MAVNAYISGAFLCATAGTSRGFSEDGYRLRIEFHEKRLSNSDVYGQMLTNKIDMGLSAQIETVLQMYALAAPVMGVRQSAGGANAGLTGKVPVIGKLTPVSTLTLTAVPGPIGATTLITTGATVGGGGPIVLTAEAASVAKGSQVTLGPGERTLPITWDLMPYYSSTESASNPISNLILFSEA
jgi:hypothetical protein